MVQQHKFTFYTQSRFRRPELNNFGVSSKSINGDLWLTERAEEISKIQSSIIEVERVPEYKVPERKVS